MIMVVGFHFTLKMRLYAGKKGYNIYINIYIHFSVLWCNLLFVRWNSYISFNMRPNIEYLKTAGVNFTYILRAAFS